MKLPGSIAAVKDRMSKISLLPRRNILLMSLVPVLLLSLWFARPASAAIAVRSASSAENGAGDTSLSLTMPSGSISGDVLVAIVTVKGGTGVTITPPSNWTQRTTNNSTTNIKSATFTASRITVGAGPYSFGFSTTSKAAGVVVAYTGVDDADPVNVSGSQANASSTTMTAPSVTTTVPNTMLVGLYGSGTSATFTAGSSMTLEAQSTSSGGGSGGTKVTSAVQDILQAGAAASGTKTMTSNAAAVSIGHLLALRPNPTVSQASYRFFQNTDSTSASTPYAAKDTPAIIPADTPFRLRLNLGVASGGSNLSSVTDRKFVLDYDDMPSASSCATDASWKSLTTNTLVRNYNNTTPADGAAYVTSANDPTRSGVTAVGQRYHETSTLTMAANTPAGQDALWDIALTTSGATPGTKMCIRARTLIGANTRVDLSSYTLAEFTIATPAVAQANYRFFANANSAAPGAPLVAQDTAATIAPETPVRLRQRLAVSSAQLSSGYSDYKLQYAEKSGVCDTGFSGETYTDVNSQQAQSSASYATVATNGLGGGVLPWSNLSGAEGAGDSQYAKAESSSTTTSNYLYAQGYGFSVPSNATITGIKVTAYKLVSSGGGFVDVLDNSIRLLKGGVKTGTDQSLGATWVGGSSIKEWGSSTSMWGTSLTPADVNASDFGVAIAVDILGDDMSVTSAQVDAVQITVYYTATVSSTLSYYDNATPADLATISTSGNDPANGARPTVYQSYRETDPFTNNVAAIPSGSDGLWDFALTSTSAANGKTYCLRVVKSDGSPLDSYSQIPEITFSSGGGGGPTTEDKTRGGRTLINGVESGFEL